MFTIARCFIENELVPFISVVPLIKYYCMDGSYCKQQDKFIPVLQFLPTVEDLKHSELKASNSFKYIMNIMSLSHLLSSS